MLDKIIHINPKDLSPETLRLIGQNFFKYALETIFVIEPIEQSLEEIGSLVLMYNRNPDSYNHNNTFGLPFAVIKDLETCLNVTPETLDKALKENYTAELEALEDHLHQIEIAKQQKEDAIRRKEQGDAAPKKLTSPQVAIDIAHNTINNAEKSLSKKIKQENLKINPDFPTLLQHLSKGLQEITFSASYFEGRNFPEAIIRIISLINFIEILSRSSKPKSEESLSPDFKNNLAYLHETFLGKDPDEINISCPLEKLTYNFETVAKEHKATEKNLNAVRGRPPKEFLAKMVNLDTQLNTTGRALEETLVEMLNTVTLHFGFRKEVNKSTTVVSPSASFLTAGEQTKNQIKDAGKLLNQKKFDEVIKLLDTTMPMLTNNAWKATAFFYYGCCHQKTKGKIKEALESFKKAKELFEKFPTLKEQLEQCQQKIEECKTTLKNIENESSNKSEEDTSQLSNSKI